MAVDTQKLRELIANLPRVQWSRTGSTVHIPETEDAAGKDISITGLDKQYARRLAGYIAAADPVTVAALLDEIERLTQQNAGLMEQHGRDSKELRRLCEDRDMCCGELLDWQPAEQIHG